MTRITIIQRGIISVNYNYLNGTLSTVVRGGYIDGNSVKQNQTYKFIHYKKNNYLDNIHQIECSNVLPNESLVLSQHFIEKKCPVCGAIQYDYGELSRLGIHKEFLGNKNFYRTNYIFGSCYTSPFNVVSNRIYKLLVDNQIDRNIRFAPLLIY